MSDTRPRGRPAGSGEQLPAKERAKKSRAERNFNGATRLDFTLDIDSSNQLFALQHYWDCKTRKETVERALAIVFQTINTK